MTRSYQIIHLRAVLRPSIPSSSPTCWPGTANSSCRCSTSSRTLSAPSTTSSTSWGARHHRSGAADDGPDDRGPEATGARSPTATSSTHGTQRGRVAPKPTCQIHIEKPWLRCRAPGRGNRRKSRSLPTMRCARTAAWPIGCSRSSSRAFRRGVTSRSSPRWRRRLGVSKSQVSRHDRCGLASAGGPGPATLGSVARQPSPRRLGNRRHRRSQRKSGSVSDFRFGSRSERSVRSSSSG